MAANRNLRTRYILEWQYEETGKWYLVGGKGKFRTNAAACKALALLVLDGVTYPLRITKKRCKARAPRDRTYFEEQQNG